MTEFFSHFSYYELFTFPAFRKGGIFAKLKKSYNLIFKSIYYIWIFITMEEL